MSEPEPLVERLIELRRQLLDAMRRDGPSPAYLGMMAGIAATLSPLDAAQVDAEGRTP